jgi:DNA-binding transcriptional LysR family regulator
MRNFDESDFLALDGRSLRVFLAVLDTGSVTAAADRLGVTQSAVSHTLERLRSVLRDPLFVKSGRGIAPTDHAEALAARARQLLDDLREFASGAHFDPATAEFNVTIAANDFQRDLLLPTFFHRVSLAAPGIRLRVIPSGVPSVDMLREARCDLLLTPRPPQGADIFQKRLLGDRWACFYDGSQRTAPDAEAYFRSRHIGVVYERGERLAFDTELEARGLARDFAVTVPNFSGVPMFLKGSTHLATLPSLTRLEIMREFDQIPLPFEFPGLSMYLVWHRRAQLDPAQGWLRALISEVATGLQA